MPRSVPSTSWYRNRSSQVLTDVNDDEIQTSLGETIYVITTGNNISTIWS